MKEGTTMSDLKVVVLAGGKGSRMHSEEFHLPKVMRLANGKPLLHYVLNALDFVPAENTVLVTGFMAETVTEAFPAYPAVLQSPQLGTGHAVQCARSELEGFEGTVLVTYGDMPMLKKQTYLDFIAAHKESGAACTLLSGTCEWELPYGRVLIGEDGSFLGVVEDRDCTPEQKKIRELNAGLYCFENSYLLPALSKLQNNNVQNEYYLTDVPMLIQQAGGAVKVYSAPLNEQLIGVNTPEQLELVEKYV